jgi:stage V sporulation protein B
VPLTLSIALCSTLVPAIAEQYFLKNMKQVKRKIDTAMILSSLIALPALCGLFFMNEPIFALIFPGKSEGAILVKYLSLSIPFIILAQITTAILQSTGKYMIPVINLSIGCLIKVIVSSILIPHKEINVFGAIIGTIIGYMVACILNINILKKQYGIKINFLELILRPALASLIMTISVVIINYNVYNITKSIGISCVVSILFGAIIYLILIFMLGILKEEEYIRRR